MPDIGVQNESWQFSGSWTPRYSESHCCFCLRATTAAAIGSGVRDAGAATALSCMLLSDTPQTPHTLHTLDSYILTQSPNTRTGKSDRRRRRCPFSVRERSPRRSSPAGDGPEGGRGQGWVLMPRALSRNSGRRMIAGLSPQQPVHPPRPCMQREIFAE